nr:DUF4394 domain-containing protein [Variovorax boronicumulans]
MPFPFPRLRLGLAALGSAILLGCASMQEPVGELRKENVFAVTAGNELIRFNAGQPQRVLSRKPVTGVAAGDALVGIDYRVSRGVLFALSRQGRLYTLDTGTGALTQVGSAPAVLPLAGPLFGFDFNPAADRIRVVGEGGQNLRLHPDTGAVVDGNPNVDGVQPDGALAYVAGDVNFGKAPAIVAAGYTYNKQDEKITTNYAIDRRLGVLVMQGSKEGTTPVVSPNTGQLRTVGPLGLGELADATLDIADVSNAAFAAVRTAGDARTKLYQIDLDTGRARFVGTVADGGPLVGMAIEP